MQQTGGSQVGVNAPIEQRVPERPSRSGSTRFACQRRQFAAGVEAGVTTFGGWVPSDLRLFLPLEVFLTCLAEMVRLPTRFFFDSAMWIPLKWGCRGYRRHGQTGLRVRCWIRCRSARGECSSGLKLELELELELA